MRFAPQTIPAPGAALFRTAGSRAASGPVPQCRGMVARWHGHLHDLATASRAYCGLARLGTFTRHLPPFRPRLLSDGKNDLAPGVPRFAQLVSLRRRLKREHLLKVNPKATLLDHLP